MPKPSIVFLINYRVFLKLKREIANENVKIC